MRQVVSFSCKGAMMPQEREDEEPFVGVVGVNVAADSQELMDAYEYYLAAAMAERRKPQSMRERDRYNTSELPEPTLPVEIDGERTNWTMRWAIQATISGGCFALLQEAEPGRTAYGNYTTRFLLAVRSDDGMAIKPKAVVVRYSEDVYDTRHSELALARFLTEGL